MQMVGARRECTDGNPDSLFEGHMTSIDRTTFPRFARRLSEEELGERYDLTTVEHRFVDDHARTQSGRLTLAVMLKARQHLGYFPACSEVPDQVRRHLTDGLGLPEDTPLLDDVRQKKGLHRYRQRLRTWLGSASFTATGQTEIRACVRAAARTMSDPADLINIAVEALAKAGIELPAFSTLDRLVGNIRQQVHEGMYASITADLDSGQRSALDALLVVPESGRIAASARLKETPGPAKLTYIRNWTDVWLAWKPFLIHGLSFGTSRIRRYASLRRKRKLLRSATCATFANRETVHAVAMFPARSPDFDA